MGSGDGRLAEHVGHLDDALLIDRHQLRRNLNAQVASGDHDAVRCFQDGLQIVEAFLVFNLGDDLNLRFALFNQDLADRIDIFRAAHEGCGDEVHIILAAEAQIALVLGGHERHGQLDARAVAALA